MQKIAEKCRNLREKVINQVGSDAKRINRILIIVFKNLSTRGFLSNYYF